MLIDTHCHLEKKEYQNLNDLIQHIFNTDVKVLIVSGYDVETSKEAVALAHQYKNMYATVGFHPHECLNISDEDYTLFDEWLKDDKVVGVGEIGLDYYYDSDVKDRQIEMFNRQIDIAIKYDKPIVVHNRNASEDIYEILKDKKARGVIHCFNDSYEMAQKFINLGFLLGIGGIITFKKNNISDVIDKLNIKNIVLETDAPYLSPEPLRGRQNTPSNLPLIASAIAKIKGIDYDEVALVTSQNAMRLFDFYPLL